ncbi:Srl4p SCDLUD_002678 [Saccharomycodes ludwigii]|uniref:Srl4p n=1 Tax=Saccharomycodes ludwigii TaxID=36035 RepID=UPI001E861206|nr:hypothetical protein SCDLUD_002678 [Saccharomycodes ludwigii]KAH3901192.1 hypothetical protein SCDLUD_002678 [Saccharomycodes ludwigii]
MNKKNTIPNSFSEKILAGVCNKIYSLTNKTFEEITGGSANKLKQNDYVLIIGGFSNMFGFNLCRDLVFTKNIKLINIDKNFATTVYNPKQSYDEHNCIRLEPKVFINKTGLSDKELRKKDFENYFHIICDDFSDKEKVLQSLAKVKEISSNIHVLINNVHEGYHIFPYKYPKSHQLSEYQNNSIYLGDPEKFHKITQSNLTNIIIATKYVLNHYNNHQSLYIINVSQILGTYPAAFKGFYAASKAGLNQFHQSLTYEQDERNKDGYYNVKTLLVILPQMHQDELYGWKQYINDERRFWESCALQVIYALEHGRRGQMYIEVWDVFHYLLRCVHLVKFWQFGYINSLWHNIGSNEHTWK